MTKITKTKKTASPIWKWLFSVVVLLGITSANVSAISIFTQNFESTWATASALSPAWSTVSSGGNGNGLWHRDDYAGADWTSLGLCNLTPTGANGTSHSARVHVYDAPSASGGDFITPVIDCSVGAAAKQLSFYWMHTTGGALFNVYVSTNGGTSYGTSVFSGTTNAGWTLQTISLGSVTSSTVKIKFSMTSSNWNCGDIWLDEVNLIDLAPCVTPVAPPILYLSFIGITSL